MYFNLRIVALIVTLTGVATGLVGLYLNWRLAEDLKKVLEEHTRDMKRMLPHRDGPQRS